MSYNTIRMAILLLTLSSMSFNAFSDVEEFIRPSIDGVRLDWCLSYGADCGEEVAYKWCIEYNYSKPLYWEIDKNIGLNEPTTTINTRETCYKDSCDGFRTIICYRSSH